MAKESKPKKKIAKVRAIGFGNYNPKVLVVFTAYSDRPADRIFMYHPDEEGNWDLPEDESPEQRNFVIVTAIERLLDLKPYAKRIHRLLVFAKPDELVRLGIPTVDVVVDERGRVSKIEEQDLDTVRGKIENDAVVLRLSKKYLIPSDEVSYNPGKSSKKAVAEELPKKKLKKKKAKKVAEPIEEPAEEEIPDSLIGYLTWFNDKFSDKVAFENAIMIPTLLRLCKQIEKDEFKESCGTMPKHGVPKKWSKAFYKFIEASLPTLGKASRKLIFPKKGKNPSAAKLADKYGVSLRDLKLVALGFERLQTLVE